MFGGIIKMSELLEAGMLICFGLSWPMSLAKNIKAHSAKNMSFRFTMLIILGYVAGIGAKIINGTYNYVLAVYFLNLVIVSANLVVYFINKKYDRKYSERLKLTLQENYKQAI